MKNEQQVRRTVNEIQNLANESLVALKMASLIHRRDRGAADTSSRAAFEMAANEWDILHTTSQWGDNDSNLQFTERRFQDILKISRDIDITRIAELLDEGIKTKAEFEDGLAKILDLLQERPYGIMANLDAITRQSEQYSTEVLKLSGQVKKSAVRLNRFLLLFKIRILRWILFRANIGLVVVIAFAVAFLTYIGIVISQNPSGGFEQLPSHVAADYAQAIDAWQQSRADGFWPKVRQAAETLHQTASLIPLVLFLASSVLFLVRRLFVDSDAVNRRILSIQEQFDRAARTLNVGKSPTINFGSFHVTNIKASSGAVVINAAYMKDVINTVTTNVQASKAPSDVKQLTADLASEIEKIATKIDRSQAEQLSGDIQGLSGELATSKPRGKNLSFFLDSIKDTAVAVGKIGVPIIDIAEKLYPLLSAS